ncbi:MAG: MltA domain-containing protein [Neisseriaceae bacterium]|nr:MltA domain-containing protein [Neisseriaceae bacterium]
MKKLLLSACMIAFLTSCAVKLPTTPTTPPKSSTLPPPPPAQQLPPAVTDPRTSVKYVPAAHAQLPNWAQQNFSKSLESFKRSCESLKNQPNWAYTCQVANQIDPTNQALVKQFFEQYFVAWKVIDKEQDKGTVTGYYEPVLHGAVNPSMTAKFPIYGVPNDMVTVDLPASARGQGQVGIRKVSDNRGQIVAGGEYQANLAEFPITERSKALKGRFEGNRFVPYYTRGQINTGILNNRAPILGYANDAVELFFLQVQGSGRMQTPDGKFVRLSYADKNEHPYKSIGRYLADRGELPLAQTSMQGIKAWVQQNPTRLNEVLSHNPSFVFFRVLPEAGNAGPIGALGVPLTDEYSGAVDRHHIELGAPIFLSTTYPVTYQPLNRLIMAQDTGSAILGGIRVDFFWGYGDKAGEVAGKMKQQGQVWQLLPHGTLPKYRP